MFAPMKGVQDCHFTNPSWLGIGLKGKALHEFRPSELVTTQLFSELNEGVSLEDGFT